MFINLIILQTEKKNLKTMLRTTELPLDILTRTLNHRIFIKFYYQSLIHKLQIDTRNNNTTRKKKKKQIKINAKILVKVFKNEMHSFYYSRSF
jgi:uncharacterized membrane protein